MSITLSSCFKKDVCNEVDTTAPNATELASLETFVKSVDPEAIFDSRGFYYRIIKSGTTNKPNICSDIYANFECTNGDGGIYYQSSNNTITMTFDLSDQIHAWRYAFPLIGMGGEIVIYVPPSLARGYNTLKAQNQMHSSIPADVNLMYRLSLEKYN